MQLPPLLLPRIPAPTQVLLDDARFDIDSLLSILAQAEDCEDIQRLITSTSQLRALMQEEGAWIALAKMRGLTLASLDQLDRNAVRPSARFLFFAECLDRQNRKLDGPKIPANTNAQEALNAAFATAIRSNESDGHPGIYFSYALQDAFQALVDGANVGLFLDDLVKYALSYHGIVFGDVQDDDGQTHDIKFVLLDIWLAEAGDAGWERVRVAVQESMFDGLSTVERSMYTQMVVKAVTDLAVLTLYGALKGGGVLLSKSVTRHQLLLVDGNPNNEMTPFGRAIFFGELPPHATIYGIMDVMRLIGALGLHRFIEDDDRFVRMRTVMDMDIEQRVQLAERLVASGMGVLVRIKSLAPSALRNQPMEQVLALLQEEAGRSRS